MQNPRQKTTPKKARRNAGIWLAWTGALGFHMMIFWLPFSGENPDTENSSSPIELQLTRFNTKTVATTAEQLPETPTADILPEHLPEPIQKTLPDAAYSVIDEVTETIGEKIESPVLTSVPREQDTQPDVEGITEMGENQLTSAILMRQFISEESETDSIFGRPIKPGNNDGQKQFHYPVRQSMTSMLDQPLPNIPFAYEEGLIYFAYDPGVKGDIQRFWDVITPEFGWRTKYGTEVKCVWVLVIAACGWK